MKKYMLNILLIIVLILPLGAAGIKEEAQQDDSISILVL